jgi:eukaryotic-like serine/threonine-protein kinase
MASPLDPIAALRAALRGHYDIEREIGQGAFATVYLARDLQHERKVVVKVLHADSSSETGELRFIREIRLLARLQHPNILPLHDLFGDPIWFSCNTGCCTGSGMSEQ